MMLLAKKNEDKTDQTKKHGFNVENSCNTKGKNHGCWVAKIFIISDERLQNCTLIFYHNIEIS
jgi:hypothetical protein